MTSATPSPDPVSDPDAARLDLTPRKLSPAKWRRYARENLLLVPIIGLFKLLGPDLGSAFGGWLGRHLFRRVVRPGQVEKNLKLAFPDMDAAERRRVDVAVWDNFGRTFAEYFHLPFFTKHRNERIAVEGAEHLDAVLATGKTPILIGNHFGHPEMPSIYLMNRGLKLTMMVRHATNPLLAERFSRMRLDQSTHAFIARGKRSAMRAFAALKRGHPLAIAVDQHVSEGLKMPFFGHPVWVTPLPAHLALRLELPILMVRCRREKGARFTTIISEPIWPEAGDEGEEAVEKLTRQLTDLTEAQVRACPEQWLWFHNRWRN